MFSISVIFLLNQFIELLKSPIQVYIGRVRAEPFGKIQAVRDNMPGMLRFAL